jgi:hypothetical protein
MPSLIRLVYALDPSPHSSLHAWLALHLVQRANPGLHTWAGTAADTQQITPVAVRYACSAGEAGGGAR